MTIVGSPVLVVAHDLEGGGGMERSLSELVTRAIADRPVTVVSTTCPQELRGQVTWHRVAVPRAPAPLKFVCFFVLGGWRVARCRSGVVHTAGAIIPNRVSVATVHYLHAARQRRAVLGGLRDLPLSRRMNGVVMRDLALLAERWCYRSTRTHVLAAVSTGVAQEIASSYAHPHVVVTSNGVDPVSCHEHTRTAIRSELGAGALDTVFLFVGGHWSHKGLGLCFRALAAARKTHTTGAFRIAVVGVGDTEHFSALARELDVSDVVHFLGRRERTSDFYCGADALLLPSVYETFSLVAHEAAAAGLPIIATLVHGVRELINEGKDGYAVTRDAGSITRAMCQVADDPAEAARRARRARERTRDLTWDATYEAVQAAYHLSSTLKDAS